MKKILIIVLGAAVAISLIFIIGLKFFFKPIVEYGLQAAGFEKAQVGSADFGFSTSTLKNIKLDDSGNAIGEVNFSSSFSELKKRQSNAVTVSGVTLNWPIARSGSSDGGQLNLFTKSLELKDITLTVATPMGPLPVKLEGSIVDAGNTYQIGKTTFKAEAGFAKLVGKVAGVVAKDSRQFKVNIELAEGSLTMPDAELLDMSGSVSAQTQADNDLPLVKGKVTVGAMKVYGVPMEGTTLAIVPTPKNTRVTLQGAVINNSGNITLDLQAYHTDAALDKITHKLDANLKDLTALEVVDMGGKGSVILSATGEHTKGQPWQDLAQWKNVQGTGGIDLQKLSLPGLVSSAEALAAFKMSLDAEAQALKVSAVEGPVSFDGKLRAFGNRQLRVDIPLNTARPPTVGWDNKTKVMILDFEGASASSFGFIGKKINAALNISLDDSPSVEGSVDIGSLNHLAPPPQRYFIPVRAALKLESGKGGTTISGDISEPNGKLSAKITGKHDGKTGKGNVSLKMPPINFAVGAAQVANVFPFTQFYFMDAFGTAGLSANFNWTRDAKGRWATANNGQLYLKDMTATVQDNVLTGINTVLNLESLSPPVVKQQTVAVAAVNVGLPLSDGVTVVSLDKDRNFTLHSAEWSAVGGKISSSAFTMPLTTMTSAVTLTAKQLDLQQLFAIAPLEGLTAEGKVDGSLPMNIEKGHFIIKNGTLSTTAPGIIRYNPQNPPSFLADTSQKQIIDLKAALTQFNYESLGLTINGELGKSQQMQMRIKGRNPLFYGGKPVNFNLNVEGPIESIIRYNPGSSRIPDSIRKLMEAYEGANAKQ